MSTKLSPQPVQGERGTAVTPQRLGWENGQQWLENATRAGKAALPSPALRSKACSGPELAGTGHAARTGLLASVQHQMGGAQAQRKSPSESDHLHPRPAKAIRDWQKSVTQAVGQGRCGIAVPGYFQTVGRCGPKAQDKDAPAKTGGRNAG